MLRWSFELLNSQDQKIRNLTTVTGGRADILAGSTIGGSARVELDNRGQPIDWMSHRLRANFHSGAKSWPVGTYLFTSPQEKHDEFRVTGYSVGLLTKLNVPLEDTFDGRFSLPAGTNVVAAAVALLQSTGETRIAATASDKVLTGPLTFEEGSPKLTAINQMLGSIGYWSLWCDGSGLYRIERYVDPASRPVAYEFEHGETSVHLPDWEHLQDNTSVPNKFVAVSARNGDDDPLVGVATNTDPGSPYSHQNRAKAGQVGRWITARETGVEAESQEVIDQIAARRLADGMDPVSLLTVTHRMLDLNPNQLVAFTPEDGRRRLATIQSMGMTFEPFTRITAGWREVA